ncbi:hypothetical protein EON67_11690 [archaeon]|nr:MAG: hypothetical protein EON67_11690 [archaeon]
MSALLQPACKIVWSKRTVAACTWILRRRSWWITATESMCASQAWALCVRARANMFAHTS